MQSVKGAQFSNITFSLVLFTAALAAAVFGTDITTLTSMFDYNHYNHIILTL